MDPLVQMGEKATQKQEAPTLKGEPSLWMFFNVWSCFRGLKKLQSVPSKAYLLTITIQAGLVLRGEMGGVQVCRRKSVMFMTNLRRLRDLSISSRTGRFYSIYALQLLQKRKHIKTFNSAIFLFILTRSCCLTWTPPILMFFLSLEIHRQQSTSSYKIKRVSVFWVEHLR